MRFVIKVEQSKINGQKSNHIIFNLRIGIAESPKRSAKGFNFQEGDWAMPL